MTEPTPSWGNASRLLEAAGVPEDTSYYRAFTAPAEKAVLTVPMRIQAAWERNDADMFADLFAENGSLLMQDEQLTSREQIRAYMKAGFAGPLKGAKVRGGPLMVQFLGPDTALVVSEGGIMLDGETEISPDRQVRVVWTIVKQDDGVRLFSHQSSPLKG
jgi:uncharacterized protein (TIGR02246 family)